MLILGIYTWALRGLVAMIDLSSELYLQLQNELRAWFLALLERYKEEQEQQHESIERRLKHLNDNDKDQQMQLNNLMRRMLNDFPVEPWNDN